MANSGAVERNIESILVVDDDVQVRKALARGLRLHSLKTRVVATYDEAVAAVKEAPPDCALVDLQLGDRSGLELLQLVKSIAPRTLVIMMSGYGSIAVAVEAMRMGAFDFITKPIRIEHLVSVLRLSGPPNAMERTRKPVTPAPAAKQHSTLARAEWEHINRVLLDCGGNISEAARHLGMHRRSLQRKLKKMPLRD